MVFTLARKAKPRARRPLQAIDMGMAVENMARPHDRLAAVAATFAAHGPDFRQAMAETIRL